MSVAIIKALRTDLEKSKKAWLWRRLLAAMEILGCGVSRLDEKVYRAWWESVMENREHMYLEVEDDGSFTWLGIPIKDHPLMEWVSKKIIAAEPRKAPEYLRRFRVCLDPPIEMVHRVGRILFENAETARDFVKLWVKCMSDNIIESPWLVNQLMITEHDEKELRTELRRRAGRYMQLKVAAQKLPVDRFAGYCGKLQKLGFDFKIDTKAVIEQKLEEEEDAKVYARALSSLKESRVFSIEDYKGWYFKVGSRFKPEVLDQAMREEPTALTPRREKRI
jgi:hypothetical protein